jgi:hypothetical protein
MFRPKQHPEHKESNGMTSQGLATHHNAQPYRRIFRAMIPLLALVPPTLVATNSLLGQSPAKVRFNRDIRPIMSDTCFKCHGPGTREADLRLDVREDAIKETGSGVVPIVPGKPDESEAVRRVLSTDPDEIMPPADSNKTLTAEQKSLIKAWVEQGAEYERHWSFEQPVKTDPPRVEGPTFRIVNPIDTFIAARLQAEGLTMSPDRSGTLSPQHLRLFQTHRPAAVHGQLRRAESRSVLHAPRPEQHAAAGPAIDERRAALRGRPRVG